MEGLFCWFWWGGGWFCCSVFSIVVRSVRSRAVLCEKGISKDIAELVKSSYGERLSYF